jgi:uncharacterized protein YcbK (DUF882 family)
MLLSRRFFLKASLIATLALSNGELAWARESLEQGLPVGHLTLLNVNTDERLDVIYRNSAGEYDLEALDAINWLLRCHYDDEVHSIDIRTLEYLNLVDQKLGGKNEIHVLSGYRSPVYNQLLQRQSPEVAKHSLHMEGRAIDLRIPGIHLSKLRRVALSMQIGGVGYYPRTNFVHIDSGEFRTW